MKILHALLIASLLSSCASFPAKEEAPISQFVQFNGARNDLFTESQPQTYQTPMEKLFEPKTPRVLQFPPSYAVECNTTKTDCKHAVVKTQLEYVAQVTGNRSVKVSGVLRSEMGRSLSWDSAPSSSYSHSQTSSIPDTAEVIRQFKEDQKFEKVLAMNEALELKGLAGVLVKLSFR